MSEFINIKLKSNENKIKFDLGRTWKHICLFQIISPHQKGKLFDICCDQIDQTMENPNRNLRRIYSSEKMISFKNLIWRKIDSRDRFISIRFHDVNNKNISFDHDIYLTIGLSNENI